MMKPFAPAAFFFSKRPGKDRQPIKFDAGARGLITIGYVRVKLFKDLHGAGGPRQGQAAPRRVFDEHARDLIQQEHT